MHAIYSTLGPQGGICRKGDECMLVIARCALREVSEATNACYFLYVVPLGLVGPPRKRRLYAIYSTLGPQGGIGCQGSDEFMLFITRWVPREVSEATNACYLQHFVTPGMGRTAKEATNACYL